MLVKVEEVITLKELVGEFGKGHSFAGLAGEAFFDAVLGHHIVHRDVLAYVAGEVEETPAFHPVVVVDKFGTVAGSGFEIEEAGELLPDAGDIVAEGLLVQKVPFLGFHRRVANHSRCTSNQSNGFVSALLKMLENHNADHMSDVEGVGSRVNPHIGSRRSFHKFLLCAGHNVLNHTPPFEFFYEILHIFCFFIFV